MDLGGLVSRCGPNSPCGELCPTGSARLHQRMALEPCRFLPDRDRARCFRRLSTKPLAVPPLLLAAVRDGARQHSRAAEHSSGMASTLSPFASFEALAKRVFEPDGIYLDSNGRCRVDVPIIA